MVKSGCTPDDLDPAIILHYRHFEHSAIVYLAGGAVFGTLFEFQFLVNSGRLNSSQWTWFKTTKMVTAARYGLTILALVPFVLGHYFFPLILASVQDSSTIEMRVSWAAMGVQGGPYAYAGFVTFGFLRYVFTRMGLDNADALGKEFEPKDAFLVTED